MSPIRMNSNIWMSFTLVVTLLLAPLDPASASTEIMIDCTNGFGQSILTSHELYSAYQNMHQQPIEMSIPDPQIYQISLQSRQFVPQPGIEHSMKSEGSTIQDHPSRYLIQFYESLTTDEMVEYEKQGMTFLQYIPDRAWVISSPAIMADKLYKSGKARWIGALSASDKIAPILNDPAIRAFIANNDRDMLALMIEFYADVSLELARQLVVKHGGTVISETQDVNSLMVLAPTSRWSALAEEDAVAWIEPPLPALTPLNDCLRYRIGADDLQASPYDLDGSGINLLIYDEGTVAVNHPAFTGRLVIGDGSSVSGHSTHVAGTAAGDGSASPDGRDLKGIAPAARIISYGFETTINPTYPLYTNPGDLYQDWSDARSIYGADLVSASIGSNAANLNCSWEGDYQTTSQLIDKIVYGWWEDPFIVIWSAGNDAGSACGDKNFYTTPPPSNAKNPIHVGAVDSDSDIIFDFSSRGPSDDGRIKPTIVAPGCEIYGDYGIESTIIPENDTYYATMCGTSMAAPAVAGLTALMIEQYRETFNLAETRPLPSTIKAILIHTALDLGNAGPDYTYGYGRVDGVAAVDAIIDQAFFVDTFDKADEVHEYRYPIVAGTPELRVSLAWDDFAAEPISSVQLVNDLDLTVISPTGQEYHPFILDPQNPARIATTGADHLNNQEQIIIPDPQVGDWTVRLTATALPYPGQRYSIVLPGARSSLSITGVSPRLIVPDGADQTLIIEGMSFTKNSQVFWNGTAINNPILINPQELKITIPATFLTGTGNRIITVVNPGTIPAQSDPFTIYIQENYLSLIPLISNK